MRLEVFFIRYFSSLFVYIDILILVLESFNLLVVFGGGYSIIFGFGIFIYKFSVIDFMKILDWDIKISDYKFLVSDRYIVFGENDKFGID